MEEKSQKFNVLYLFNHRRQPFCTPAEIKNQFFTAGAKLLVTHSAYIHKLSIFEDFTSKLPVITVDNPPAGCLPYSVLSSADETTVPDVSVNSDDTVALPFSSGTTGFPKGVELTHRNLVSSIAQKVHGENPNLYLKTEDVVLCVLPLFHIYSLNSVFLCSWRAGAAVLLKPKFEIAAMLAAVERHRVTVAAVVSPLVLALAKKPLVEKYDLSSIRFVVSGTVPLGKELEGSGNGCRTQFSARQKYEAAGEVPVAFIVRSNDNELKENEVKEFISKQVVFYKRLHKVYFVHTIPKSQAGKVLRKELRAKLAYSAPNYSGILPMKQENLS